MATAVSFCDAVLTNSAVTGNGTFTIFTSSNVTNNNDIKSLRVVAKYSNPVPLDGNPDPTAYSIQCVIEGRVNTDVWYPIAYQYEPWRNFDEGDQRIILLQPNLSTIDTGIDDIIYAGGATVARLSRQQGVAANPMRLRVLLRETAYGTPQAFQSIHLEVKGELFDV